MAILEPSTVAATFSGVSALAAVATASVAGYALVGSRRDSRDRSRPVVVARLKLGPRSSHGDMYLVVSNVGQSVARGVLVTFDPALPTGEITASGKPRVVGPFISRRYAEPIATMAPGEQFANLFNYIAGRGDDEEAIPERTEVHIAYTDDHGRSYIDTFVLSLDDYATETTKGPGDGGTDWTKRQARALESAVYELWRRT